MKHALAKLFCAKLLASAVVLCLFWGCNATETGNPGFTHEVELEDVSVATVGFPNPPAGTSIEIGGNPGSVSPATGTVYAWALENNVPAVTAEVDPDGSFFLFVEALPLDRIRVQVRAAPQERSVPIDLIVSDEGGFARVNSELSCLTTSPGPDLLMDAGSEDAIILTNECTETVIRSAARLREALPGFTIEDQGPMEIAPGQRSTIVVRSDVSARPIDNVVFSISSPIQEVRAITVATD